jgi:hypothetical protein
MPNSTPALNPGQEVIPGPGAPSFASLRKSGNHSCRRGAGLSLAPACAATNATAPCFAVFEAWAFGLTVAGYLLSQEDRRQVQDPKLKNAGSIVPTLRTSRKEGSLYRRVGQCPN